MLFWISYTTIIIFILLFGSSLIISFLTRTPYLPSRSKIIDTLIKNIQFKSTDRIVDLGCGDMKVLLKIEKSYNVSGTGYEISLFPYLIAKLKICLLQSKCKIELKNFLKQDLSRYNYIFVYLTPHLLEKTAKKILAEANKGTTIISNTFQIPDLKLVKTINVTSANQQIYIYKV